MGRYSDFAHFRYADLILYSGECPQCSEKSSYRREDITRSGHVRCRKCGTLFRISK